MIVQPDFYCKRGALPGICVFVDGAPHDAPRQAAHDKQVREVLEDRGFKVIVVRYDRPFAEQVTERAEVYGSEQ